MKRVKYVFWLVIIGLVALAVYQNQEFFTVTRSLGIDLYFYSYESPKLPTGVYYLSVFLIGMLLSYIFSLSHKFKSRRTIRQLNEKIAAHEKKIAGFEATQARSPQAPETPPQAADTQREAPETPPDSTEESPQASQGPSKEATDESGRMEKQTDGKDG